MQVGPFFNENVWARPNIELGFGEVTTLVAINFEGIYRIPVTQRGVATSVHVSSGHVGADAATLAALAAGATVVLLMAVSSLGDICAAALAAGVDAELPVAMVEQGSTSRERVTRAMQPTAPTSTASSQRGPPTARSRRSKGSRRTCFSSLNGSSARGQRPNERPYN